MKVLELDTAGVETAGLETVRRMLCYDTYPGTSEPMPALRVGPGVVGVLLSPRLSTSDTPVPGLMPGLMPGLVVRWWSRRRIELRVQHCARLAATTVPDAEPYGRLTCG